MVNILSYYLARYLHVADTGVTNSLTFDATKSRSAAWFCII